MCEGQKAHTNQMRKNADIYHNRIVWLYRQREGSVREEKQMKIGEKNGVFSISFGAMDSTERQKRADGRSRTIFAKDLGKDKQESAIDRKRKEVRDRAMKVLLDKFEGDQKYEQDLDESRGRIAESQAAFKEAKENADQAREKLGTISREEDPELYDGYEQYIEEQENLMREAEGSIIGENAYIRSAKQAKLGEKYSMANAVVEEEKILRDGRKEVMGVAIEESMSYIEDMYQENIEKAQEEKEKKEEQEEKLEAVRDKKKELEGQIDAAKTEAARAQEDTAEKVNETVTETTDMDRELQKIQKEGELIDEELKGLLVDAKL